QILPLVHDLSTADIDVITDAMGGEGAMIVVADALHRSPDDARLYEILGNLSDNALAATFGPVQFAGGKEQVAGAWAHRDGGAIGKDAERKINARGTAGRAADALAVYAALPPAARKEVIGGEARITLVESAILERQTERANELY